jgi:hypothetical protein
MDRDQPLVGTTIAHYTVGEKLGEGGMGAVYRARDTKLGRDIALKVLSLAFSGSAERMALLRREAQVLASLNHPNIAAIYGLEEAEGTHALIMELVEGPTLADRIARGAIPTEEALPIARQIAEALETAHEKGFVHRDLKPANVKITPGGTVKLLDFGLAKAYAPPEAGRGAAGAATLTLRETREGLILGTAAYMSPEQARGADVDKRADIWAFGAVLFEMLTGRRAFEGETISDVLAGVLKSEPDWSLLPADVPADVRDLLRRCLRKDMRRRVHDIADARIAIEDAPAPGAAADGHEGPESRPTPAWRRFLPWGLAGALAVALAASLWVVPRRPQASSPARVSRVTINLPKGVVLAPAEQFPLGIGRPLITLSRDGGKLACVVLEGERTKIMVRSLEAPEFSSVAGTDGAHSPFFSPDGNSLGYFADGRLKTVSLSGGSPLDLASAPSGYGGCWSPDGSIIYAPAPGPLMMIRAEGGTSSLLLPASSSEPSRAYFWPELLPEGRAVICTIAEGIYLLSLDSGARKLLVPDGSFAKFLPSGHLLYGQGGRLLSAPFDPRRLEITGPSAVVLEGVRTELPPQGRSGMAAQFSIADDGTVVYIGGGDASVGALVWVDRNGKTEPLDLPARDYGNFKISPDGRKVAMTLYDQGRGDIWIYEPGRPLVRFTAEGMEGSPIWSKDGRWILYQRREGGKRRLLRKPADGSASQGEIVANGLEQGVSDITDDGRFGAGIRRGPSTLTDIWIQPLNPQGPAYPLISTPFFESFPVFSPDGHWLAYISDESGRWEVYIRPFPGPGPKLRVSRDGGEEPRWSQDGKEIFFRYGPKWMSASIETGPVPSASPPRVIFEGPYLNIGGYSYDVAPDGKRFLVLRGVQDPSPAGEIEVILNGSGWIESKDKPSRSSR